MSQDPALGCVVGRFPNREDVITNLYRNDQEFQTLCEDYCDCLKSLERWTGETGENASVYQQDYRELLAELELEILKYADRSGKNTLTRI